MRLDDMIQTCSLACPYCGESFDTQADCSAGSQIYVEDCPVCCAPIVFDLAVDADGMLSALTLRREND